MLVWKDILSGDEMVSDSYPHKLTMGDACLEVKAKMITKGNEDFGIENNDEDGGALENNAEQVINVVDAGKLIEVQGWTKKEFTVYVKAYLKKIVAHLKENGKEDRVPDFQKGATELTKFILGKWDEMQIFCGESNDLEGAFGFAYWADGDTDGPTFLFFADGLKEEKY